MEINVIDAQMLQKMFIAGAKNLEAKKAIVFGPKGSIVRNKRVQETSKDNFLLPLDVWPTDHKGLLVTFKIK